MERILKFLKEAETYYLATVEGDQPRVRPFGTAHIFEGKLYIQTGKKKEVSKQIHEIPRWRSVPLKMESGCAWQVSLWRMTAGKQGSTCWMPIHPYRRCTPLMMEIQRCFILEMLQLLFLPLPMNRKQ